MMNGISSYWYNVNAAIGSNYNNDIVATTIVVITVVYDAIVGNIISGIPIVTIHVASRFSYLPNHES